MFFVPLAYLSYYADLMLREGVDLVDIARARILGNSILDGKSQST